MEVLNHRCGTCHAFDEASLECIVCGQEQCRDCINEYMDAASVALKVCSQCHDRLQFCNECDQPHTGEGYYCAKCDKRFCRACCCKVSDVGPAYYCMISTV
jgi:hypothetical protein